MGSLNIFPFWDFSFSRAASTFSSQEHQWAMRVALLISMLRHIFQRMHPLRISVSADMEPVLPADGANSSDSLIVGTLTGATPISLYFDEFDYSMLYWVEEDLITYLTTAHLCLSSTPGFAGSANRRDSFIRWLLIWHLAQC